VFSARLVTTSRESFGKYRASQSGSLLDGPASEGFFGGRYGTAKRVLEVGFSDTTQVLER